jgi:tetratricopeptide (TPR) repeat protein
MTKMRTFVFGLSCFVFGAIVQTGLAQKRNAFDATLFQGKEPKAAAAGMLDHAMKLAEDGSWERIAVGRAWYLGGDKAKGQQIFDAVTGSKKAKSSDWFRVGRVYVESNEWEKAQAAFDKAIALEPDDDSGMLEFGAFLNVHKDRERAEALFSKALSKNPGDFWHWVGAGGSYLGVPPQ